MIPLGALSGLDPQIALVTLAALIAAALLIRGAIGPRRRKGCGSCAPRKSPPPG
jgi:hypothetical protein